MIKKLLPIAIIGIFAPICAMQKEGPYVSAGQPGESAVAQQSQVPGKELAATLVIAHILQTSTSLDEAVNKIRALPNISKILQENPSLVETVVNTLLQKFRDQLISKYSDIVHEIEMDRYAPKKPDDLNKILIIDELSIPGAFPWLRAHIEKNQLEMLGYFIAIKALGNLFSNKYRFNERGAKIFYTISEVMGMHLGGSGNRLYAAKPFKKVPDTALTIAVKFMHPAPRAEFVEYFLKYGANPNQVSQAGELPLNEVVKSYSPDNLTLIRALLKAGADPLKKDDEGKSALDIVNKGLEFPYTTFGEYVHDLESRMEPSRPASSRPAPGAAAQTKPSDGRPDVELRVYGKITGTEAYLSPHEILGVPVNASDDQVKKAYRRLGVRWHPDKNKDDLSAEDAFKLISWASQEGLKKPRPIDW